MHLVTQGRFLVSVFICGGEKRRGLEGQPLEIVPMAWHHEVVLPVFARPGIPPCPAPLGWELFLSHAGLTCDDCQSDGGDELLPLQMDAAGVGPSLGLAHSLQLKGKVAIVSSHQQVRASSRRGPLGSEKRPGAYTRRQRAGQLHPGTCSCVHCQRDWRLWIWREKETQL